MAKATDIYDVGGLLKETDALFMSFALEDLVAPGEDEAEVFVDTISPGAAGIYQVQEAAEFFNLTLSPEDIEELGGRAAVAEMDAPWTELEWGWEGVEAVAEEASEQLSEEAKERGYPFWYYFGNLEADGSYGLFARISAEDYEERYEGSS